MAGVLNPMDYKIFSGYFWYDNDFIDCHGV